MPDRTRITYEPNVLRNRKIVGPGGTLVSSTNWLTSTGLSQCDDWRLGMNSSGDFQVRHLRNATLSYEYINGLGMRITNTNDVLDPVMNHQTLEQCGSPIPLDANIMATIAAGRTNPSRPDVSIPQFIGELGELPKAILNQGRKGITWAGNSPLGIRFGILPMVSDVLKMMHFQDHVTQRGKELDRLSSGRGLKRRIRLGRYQATVQVPHHLENGHTNAQHWSAAVSTIWNVWAVCKWKPAEGQDALIPPKGSDERNKLVKALLRGTSKRNDIYSYARDVWEILPWSWMIDWFTNCGDFLDANRNQNIASLKEAWIMAHAITTHVEQCPAWGSHVTYLEDKIRFLGEVSLEAYQPHISADKMAILSSLAIGDPHHKLPVKYR